METSDKGALDRLFSWMVNYEIKKNSIDFAKAKVIIIFVFILDILCIIMAGWQLSVDDVPVAVAIFSAGVLITFVPFFLRKVTSFIFPGVFLTALLYVLITYIVATGGGIMNYAVAWYGMVFLLAFIILGTTGGGIFGTLSVVTMGILYLLEVNGVIDGLIVNKASESLIVNGLNLLGLTILLVVYSGMNKRFQDQLVTTAKKKGEDEKARADILQETNSVMSSVSQGNLTKRIVSEFKGFEQLKTTINKALDMLSNTISKVSEVSEKVTTGANELSRSSQTLADGTSQQAANLEEISSSMGEIGNQAKINSESSEQARSLSNQTTRGVVNGNEQMQMMVASMEKINNTSSEVSKVIKVIDEIAFQTNLLALNAAVEAARAGKYGKGFAVVAEEVRNLASRSAEAAKNTTELIENAIKEVENGVENATKTAEMLDGIKVDIEKVNDFIGEITASSKEQVAGVNEINESLNQINDIVQQNSSISEQSASASNELSSQASDLQKMVQGFKLSGQPVKLGKPTEERRKKKKPQPPVPQFDRMEDKKKKKTITLDDGDFGKY